MRNFLPTTRRLFALAVLTACAAAAAQTYPSKTVEWVVPYPAGGGTDVVARTLAESCLLYTSPSPRDKRQSRMPSSA